MSRLKKGGSKKGGSKSRHLFGSNPTRLSEMALVIYSGDFLRDNLLRSVMLSAESLYAQLEQASRALLPFWISYGFLSAQLRHTTQLIEIGSARRKGKVDYSQHNAVSGSVLAAR